MNHQLAHRAVRRASMDVFRPGGSAVPSPYAITLLYETARYRVSQIARIAISASLTTSIAIDNSGAL